MATGGGARNIATSTWTALGQWRTLQPGKSTFLLVFLLQYAVTKLLIFRSLSKSPNNASIVIFVPAVLDAAALA